MERVQQGQECVWVGRDRTLQRSYQDRPAWDLATSSFSVNPLSRSISVPSSAKANER